MARLDLPKLATLACPIKSTSETAVVYEKGGPRWYFELTTGILGLPSENECFLNPFRQPLCGLNVVDFAPYPIVRFA